MKDKKSIPLGLQLELHILLELSFLMRVGELESGRLPIITLISILFLPKIYPVVEESERTGRMPLLI